MKAMHLHFSQAFITLSAARMRSFLAVLGVLIGTAAVVALMSCGQLATDKALEQFKALGTDLSAIMVFPKDQQAGGGADRLPLSFWRQLPEKIAGIRLIAPYGSAYQAVSFQGIPLKSAVIGADDGLAQVIHINMASGHFVSFVDSFEHYCVIGSSIAKNMESISMDNPIGKQLRIGNALYTIIGVAAPWVESGFFNENINESVIIPIAGLALVSKDSRINNAIIKLQKDANVDETLQQAKLLVEQQAPQMTVYARGAKQLIQSMESQGRIFTWLLAVIGGISLLVGGIGVMNVMLVAVSERKKEIGIRKAIGAKNSEIQSLFLTESVLLSLFGGTVGVLMGLLFTWIIAHLSDWTFTVHFLPIGIGFLVSVATGIFFGFYPARRASQLEAIVCLRSE